MTTEKTPDPLKRLQHFRLLTHTHSFTDLITTAQPRVSIINARLVYSWLAYRSRLGLSTSIRSIQRDVGLHAATIRQAIAALGPLVNLVGTDWYAVEPSPGLFHERSGKQGQHWSDQLAYSVVFLPRKGATVVYSETKVRFGLNHALVWSHMVRSRNKDAVVARFTIGGTAALYGLADNTVRSVLNDLVWLKLVTRIDKGGHSEIMVHVSSGESLNLFRIKKQTPTGAPQPPVERKPRPFTLQDDGWDKCRHLCHGLMPQSLADTLVAMAKELEETPHDFRNEFARLRPLYETNKKAEGKFGAYLKAAYENRVHERRTLATRRAEEERHTTMMANTDWHAFYQKRAIAAAHDPRHKDFRYDEQAVFDRVDFGPDRWTALKLLTRLLDSMEAPISTHVRTNHKHLDTQAEVDLKSTLRAQVRRGALVGVNTFYKRDIKASVEEFKTALDEALAQLGLNKVFSPTTETTKSLT